VIYSFNKSQQNALFLKNNYIFRTDLLSIIRSLTTVFTAFVILVLLIVC